jgi:epoxyqueuosine reductase
MKNHHSTVSRRDFMKTLGLGSAAAGLATLSSPVFHDLDEVLASPMAERKLPPWVREVDKPTVEIDWQRMQRFDGTKTVFNPPAFAQAIGPVDEQKLRAIGGLFGEGGYGKRVSDNKPGYQLKDLALNMGGRFFMHPDKFAKWKPFLGPQIAPTPKDLGVPRYEGKPEENSRMVRAALKLFGASTVGFVEIDDNTRKLFYSTDAFDKKQVIFDNVEEPIETDTQRIIPSKAAWAIVFSVRMSPPSISRAPYPISQAAVGMGYSEGALIANRLQEFLRTLGYHCMAESNILGSLANSGGFGVMAGLGELSRLNRVITPEYGPIVRIFKVATDLPLAPSKPIDAGIWKFCRTCKKCAETCPTKTLSMDDPSWEVKGFWNNPGVKAYYEEAPKCLTYWRQSAGSCIICFAVCPFTKQDKSFMHAFVQQTIAAAPAFNGLIRKMDDIFGYGQLKDPESWWDMELPPYGYQNITRS